MKVAFHSQFLTERGSEGAMLDYARLNRSVLGNESLICLPHKPDLAGHPILKKWQEEFVVMFYTSKNELGRKLAHENVEVVYLTKPGPWDGFLVPGLKNCVHAQFLYDEFHGDAYVYLSPWMSNVMTGRKSSFVPFFVPRLQSPYNLRPKLGIPHHAKVFGRHGGWDTFNIPFVHEAVRRHAQMHPEDHFVFLNTKPLRGTGKMKNIHYLPATVEPGEKAAFLGTCDAMLHARWHGETFGMAVGEFAILGKPVLTYAGSREQAHLEMLGSEALRYHDGTGLRKILSQFQKTATGRTLYHDFGEPRRVMEFFREKFLS